MKTPEITLLNTDCMEYLTTLADKSFELAICDPPYGIGINMNMGRRGGKRKMHEDKDWDAEMPSEVFFSQIKRVSTNQIVWGGNYFTAFLQPTGAWVYWAKGVPVGVDFADGELAWTSFGGTLKQANVKYSGFQGMDIGGKVHPTQKPVKLYRWLLHNYAKPGDKILDTHLGSGSSAIAAHQMGFDFVGCEIDLDYYNAACKRFKEQTAQLDMFKP